MFSDKELKIIENLKKLAMGNPLYDRINNGEDTNAYDCSGGNYDDAWAYGMGDGETYLAREILDELGIEYEVPT